MARAFPASGQDYGQEPHSDEWQSLRGELEALLHEVETQVARTSRHDPGYAGLADRLQGLRDQLNGAPPVNRHREALRSVQRAVDRFTDRDDGLPFPSNARESLENAISEIRTRQANRQPAPAPAPRRMQAEPQQRYVAPPQPERVIVPPVQERMVMPPQPDFTPRFDELARAVTGISGRLESLELDLRAQRVDAGKVRDVAEQLGQLTQVVEMLAGAVGETGQVKRLETQIAALAKVVSQGQRVDVTALTQRLDDVSATVERLADLQVQHVARERDLPAQQTALVKASMDGIEKGFRSGFEDIEKGVLAGMEGIERNVRNVYDRIDSIEKNFALGPAEFEKLTTEMAVFTEAMKGASQPQELAGLVELVELLSQRINGIESRDGDVRGLKTDILALREAVLGSVEPRFAALESQMEALNERVANSPGELPGVGQLEAQVRQLVARMDQTGEQLSGLARMYEQAGEREAAAAPDFEALADLVASRTERALARLELPAFPAQVPQGISAGDIDELELRVARLLQASARQTSAAEDFSGVSEGIRRVDERLERLETALGRLNAEQVEPRTWTPQVPEEPVYPPQPRAYAPSAYAEQSYSEPAPASRMRPVHETEDEDYPSSSPSMIRYSDDIDAPPTSMPARGDSMPISPAVDRPLIEKPYADPVRTALEAKNGPRKRHPGLDSDDPPGYAEMSPVTSQMLGGSQASGYDAPALAAPVFDPDVVEKPPRPESAFDEPAREVFSSGTVPAPVAVEKPAVTSSARNTFIEAQRRAAAQRSAAPPAAKTSIGANSLLGRALARFQGGNAPATDGDKPAQPAAEKPAKPEKKQKPERAPKAQKIEPAAAAAAAPIESISEPAPAVAAPAIRKIVPVDGRNESFLTRHRKPILLGASIIALSFLTLNLITQRMASTREDGSTQPMEAGVVDTGEAAVPNLDLPTAPIPVAEVADAVPATGPRVIPMVDNLATGSISPTPAMAFAPATTPLPQAFAAVTGDEAVAIVPEAIVGPVEVELPPETLGPPELRQAAADGDARAQFEVAAIYTEGRAVPQNLEEAAKWYERAAAQGFAPAQYRLGNLYENGKGVTKDLVQSKLWYQRAAEAGNRMSMHNLAALYAGGGLGKQEFDSAARWFEQAAARGMTDSQFNLGMLYARGLGVPQDMEVSFKWFSIAARSGDEDAAKARDDIAASLGADAVGRLNDEVEAWRAAEIDLAANFAPIGTWSETFDPGPVIDKIEVVTGVQTVLNRLGYDVGTPDGLAGPRTGEAIRAFERATGMSETGKINPRLLAVLSSQPV